jgi:hypothetical protein
VRDRKRQAVAGSGLVRAAGPIPIANWCHVENGKIIRIRNTFDPRSLLR